MATFLSLATETRLEIYRHLRIFPATHPSGKGHLKISSFTFHPAILRVNKTTNAEARAIFYENNTFKYTVACTNSPHYCSRIHIRPQEECPSCGIISFWTGYAQAPPPFSYIQHVQVEMSWSGFYGRGDEGDRQVDNLKVFLRLPAQAPALRTLLFSWDENLAMHRESSIRILELWLVWELHFRILKPLSTLSCLVAYRDGELQIVEQIREYEIFASFMRNFGRCLDEVTAKRSRV